MGISDPFRQIFKQTLIEELKNNFSILSGNTWFLGIGKVASWVDTDGLVNDDNPNQNIDSLKSDTDFWRSALAFRKITTDDVCIVVPRYDWQSNQIYTAYRDDIDLHDDQSPAKFYVLVDEDRVYKCIDNNYGASSTVAPTHTDAQIRTLGDGYRWKYLYSITDSKRKFLTTGSSSNPGYMPVEYIQYIKNNDERILQWDVQNASVTGSIDYIDLDQTIRSYILSDRVLFFDSSNQIVGATGPGATQLTLGGSKIVPQNNYYDNMVIRIESGMGIGQQRIITNYVYNSNGTGTVLLKNPLNYGVTGGTGSDASLYSILPNVSVVGDGSADVNASNTYATTAEVTVKFLTAGATGFTGQRYLDSFDLSNNGKDYTYAKVSVVAGLTFASGITSNFDNLATAVMSPFGGHGSNPVKELGAAAMMIVTELAQSEDGKITVGNDYRQFAFVKNPLLSKKHVVLNFIESGISGSFVSGATASQGYTGFAGITNYDLASGLVVSWEAGTTGQTGTSELVLTNVSGGNFAVNGKINSFTITDIRQKTVAGTEGRLLQRLKLTPINATSFDGTGLDFYERAKAIGYGCTSTNITPSFANGSVYSWEPELGSNSYGNLYLEYPNGSFLLNEHIWQTLKFENGISGPKGKIVEIDELDIPYQEIYDQTLKLSLRYDGVNTFTGSSFPVDTGITGMSGSTASATGIVVDWTVSSGNTAGILSLIQTTDSFSIGNTILYNSSNSTGATVIGIDHLPELVYRSGDLVHSQNIRPITRSSEQKEEIKLIIEF